MSERNDVKKPVKTEHSERTSVLNGPLQVRCFRFLELKILRIHANDIQVEVGVEKLRVNLKRIKIFSDMSISEFSYKTTSFLTKQ